MHADIVSPVLHATAAIHRTFSSPLTPAPHAVYRAWLGVALLRVGAVLSVRALLATVRSTLMNSVRPLAHTARTFMGTVGPFTPVPGTVDGAMSQVAGFILDGIVLKWTLLASI